MLSAFVQGNYQVKSKIHFSIGFGTIILVWVLLYLYIQSCIIELQQPIPALTLSLQLKVMFDQKTSTLSIFQTDVNPVDTHWLMQNTRIYGCNEAIFDTSASSTIENGGLSKYQISIDGSTFADCTPVGVLKINDEKIQKVLYIKGFVRYYLNRNKVVRYSYVNKVPSTDVNVSELSFTEGVNGYKLENSQFKYLLITSNESILNLSTFENRIPGRRSIDKDYRCYLICKIN